jgi:hypothetical protein
MPRQDFADITVVLDRSGSMEKVAQETVSGFNHFIGEQKKAPGQAVLTLVQFDTQYEFVHRAKPVAEIPSLIFQPRGWTALFDAMGRAINETGERLSAMSENDRPGKVIFVTLTDGLENSSREFSRERIFQMISHQREVYGWEFLFLGANQDAIGTAAKIGITMDAAMTYAGNPAGTSDAYVAASAAVLRSRSGGAAHFLQSDRDKQTRHMTGSGSKS